MNSMAGRRVRVVIFMTTVVLSVVTASPSTWAASGPRQSAPKEPGLNVPAARSLNQQRPRRTVGRLATDLRDDAGLSSAPTGYETYYRAPRDASGRVHVLVSGADASAIQGAVEANGGAVRIAVSGKVDAVVPADRLAALSEDPSVTFVENGKQYRAEAGNVTSQGVANTSANKWHNGGKQGAGVNVAVVDPGGFQGYDTELGDELPAVVGKKNFCGSNPDVFDSSFTGDPHGAEVAAIVHDMAPAAGITLICATNDAQLVQAQNYIIGLNSDGNSANDIRIVNGSFGNPIGGRGDGSGGASTGDGVVRTLRQNNVLFVAAAGNEADMHFDFVPAGPDVPGPGGSQLVAWQPNNYEDGILVPANTTVTMLIKWDAWTGPAKDFDLMILNSSGFIVAGSQLDQLAGAPPIEGVDITNNSGSSQFFYAAIDRFSSSTNPRFDTYLFYATSELVDVNGSITVPASSPYALAAGAACVSNNVAEPYSSRGPTIDGRIKPDMTGPDGTSGQITNSIDPYGPANSNCSSGFTGTSASAPHIAGAAALVKSVDLGLDANSIQFALQGMAIDISTPGVDNQTGVGRLSLQPKAVGGPTSTTVGGQTLTVVRGSDRALWELMPNGTWNRLGGILTSDPTLSAMPSGRVDLFARGGDNALWHMQSNDAGVTWGPWGTLGGILSSGPTSVSWGENRIDVFVRGVDGALWHLPFAGGYLGWRTLGGGLTSDPEVSSWSANRLDVFVRGLDGALWHIDWFGTGWSGWEPLGGGITGGAGAASTSPGTVDVFARGLDGALWSREWNGSAWISWFSLGGGLAADPDAAATASQIDVLIQGNDGALWRRRRASGIWQPWVLLGPPSFS
jgi:hypothetical protein